MLLASGTFRPRIRKLEDDVIVPDTLEGLEDVNRHLGEAEAGVRQVGEERDGLATLNVQLVDNRAWMRQFGVVHIVNAILEARENTAVVANVNKRAREAGFKAGYNQCLNDVNALSTKQFTDERCALRGVDTEAAYSATIDAYNGLTVDARNVC
ncbi:hypothetical protein HanHA300_Chr03g0084061 [Helianthus annuus]|nr:hypothetical protein HanHA300_Chr03g0084061 [Helianthus annuus]KAJ0599885.1 hypothetical protein HanIR_Chr03g0110201 [Helianthus annuus]KAJ0607340.1 hypothetical protein HanHA89_Chr03g0095571 [Helianthus annuus]KAJ0773236.1 hypothetical protein HanOQP8_Chr03g0096821 [Helianthus annuus]KAJ0942857.1 hypothetical protein HanPSC8_Chr03g0097151 [Helianthus annuus]